LFASYLLACAFSITASAEEVIFSDDFETYASTEDMFQVWEGHYAGVPGYVTPELITAWSRDGELTQVCRLPEDGYPVITTWPGVQGTDEEPVIYEVWFYHDGYQRGDQKGVSIGHWEENTFTDTEPYLYMGQYDWNFFHYRGKGSVNTSGWSQTGISYQSGWRLFKFICDSDGITCSIDGTAIQGGEIPYTTLLVNCWNGIALGFMWSDTGSGGAALYDDVRITKGYPIYPTPTPVSGGKIIDEDFEAEGIDGLESNGWDISRVIGNDTFLATERVHLGERSLISYGMCGDEESIHFNWGPIKPSNSRPIRISFWACFGNTFENEKKIRCTSSVGGWFEWGMDTKPYAPADGKYGSGRDRFHLRSGNAWTAGDQIHPMAGVETKQWHYFELTMTADNAVFTVDGATQWLTPAPIHDMFNHIEIGAIDGPRGTAWFDDLCIEILD